MTSVDLMTPSSAQKYISSRLREQPPASAAQLVALPVQDGHPLVARDVWICEQLK